MLDVQEFIDSFRDFPIMKSSEQERFLKIIRTPPPGVPPDATEWVYTPAQDAAREEFLCRNIRLVIHTVKTFVRIEDPKAIDLINAGCIGLVKGVDAFDVSKRVVDNKGRERMYKFSTYATHWIRAEIFKQLKVHDTKVIQFKALYSDIKRLRREYLSKKQFRTDAQLYEELGWDESTIAKYEADDSRLMVPLDTVATSPDNNAEVDSSLLTDAPQDSVLEEIFNEEVREMLFDSLATLTPLQQRILRLRYGFEDARQKGLTYDQISAEVNMTRERVKQVEHKALEELWYILGRRAPSLRE